ncbi:intracellular protein transport protein USO1 [Reticulomyxa filosa]|uniref:Intracellular protein transport protein USO1 n=1 Tax=Reticulomyxa filosa TaxID=46433 RepID=X6MQH0_RETFI|nr:intracellular protein transport protein USO1 [Reticulomyxa filosa]|eukprot:ETO15692.1 intracellular protein transport protein USO1 [Reticulomyxa filosa]
MSAKNKFVSFEPQELFFECVELDCPHTQFIEIKNETSHALPIQIKAGTPNRYKISPDNFTLGSLNAQTISIELCIKRTSESFYLLRNPSLDIKKDIFYIRSQYFNEKFYAKIQLLPSDTEGGKDNSLNIKKNFKVKMEIENIQLKNDLNTLQCEAQHWEKIRAELLQKIPNIELIVDASIQKERTENEMKHKKNFPTTLHQMLQEYTNRQVDIQVTEEHNEKYKQEIIRLSSENHQLQTANKNIQASADKNSEQIITLTNNVQYLKNALQEKEIRIEELNQSLNETQRLLERSNETLKSSYQQQLREYEIKLETQEKKLSDLTHDMSNKNQEVEKYNQKMNDLKNVIQELTIYKKQHEQYLKEEIQKIQSNFTANQVPANVLFTQEHLTQVQQELAKLRAVVRMGFVFDCLFECRCLLI